ncbi:hypothetical protein SD457_15130 [Coprobacillaceae bacterium CR2/5/TPMF4]|nr:hypothetical protein SD457_15130 [Coprobacillaceae bacterium CR2/5/TPMF4]
MLLDAPCSGLGVLKENQKLGIMIRK